MMARRRHAALALVVGLMAGVTNRGLAQAAVSVSLAVVNDSISPAPQILVQGTPGPPSLGPYNVSLEVALEPLFRAPFLVRSSSRPVSVVPGRLAATRAHRRVLPRPNLRRSRQLQEQIRVPGAQLVELDQSAQRDRRPVVRGSADSRQFRQRTDQVREDLVRGQRDHHHQHGERTDQAVHGERHELRAANPARGVHVVPVERSREHGERAGVGSDHGQQPRHVRHPDRRMPDGDAPLSEFSKPVRRRPSPNTCFWFDLAIARTCRSTSTTCAGATCARSSPACRRRSSTPELRTAERDRGDATTASSGTGATPPGATPARRLHRRLHADGLRSTIKILYRGP